MSKWVLLGMTTGVKTTPYPNGAETAAGISPGRATETVLSDREARSLLSARCPTSAISVTEDRATVDYRHCVSCFRCLRGSTYPMQWEESWEWASQPSSALDKTSTLGRSFSRSLHIRVVDAGACRACLSEIEQLGKPYYNIHRLGFFMTPSPRQADVLLVAGPVTDNMRLPLEKAYDAMPSPKRVIAVGTCALSGGVFGPSFTCFGGVKEVLPVDLEIFGCPPPPLAIIHGLLVLTGKKRATETNKPVRLIQREGKR